MKNQFFLDRPNIKQEELRELVSCATLDRRQQFENVFRCFDEGEHFYIILQGMVRVKIPNPTIKNWTLERQRFDELLAWKADYLDPKIDRAIKLKYECRIAGLDFVNSEMEKKILKYEVKREKLRYQLRFRQGFKKSGIRFKFDVFRHLELGEEDDFKLN